MTAIIDTIGRVEDFDELDEEATTLPHNPEKGATMAKRLLLLKMSQRKKLYRKTNEKY